MTTSDFPLYVIERNPSLLGDEAQAVFSEDHIYRYQLTRIWGTGKGNLVLWIMLNPSTADAFTDDPTITRCCRFTQAWGHDGLKVVNLFALRATDPAELKRHAEPVGAGNDAMILAAVGRAPFVVAAWGAHAFARERAAKVAALLVGAGVRLHCLGRTKDGSPKHPLYVPARTPLEPYDA